MWLIPTDFGQVVRSGVDVERETADTVCFNTESSISIFPREFPRAGLKTTLYSQGDLPDMTRTETEISNVCGFVAGFSSLHEAHPAWKTVRSTLGCFKEVRGGLVSEHPRLTPVARRTPFAGATCSTFAASSSSRAPPAATACMRRSGGCCPRPRSQRSART